MTMDQAMQTKLVETATRALKSKDGAIKNRGARIERLLAVLPIAAGTPFRAKLQTRTERQARQASFQIARFEAEDEAITQLKKETAEQREACNKTAAAIEAMPADSADALAAAQKRQADELLKLNAAETQLNALLKARRARRGSKTHG